MLKHIQASKMMPLIQRIPLSILEKWSNVQDTLDPEDRSSPEDFLCCCLHEIAYRCEQGIDGNWIEFLAMYYLTNEEMAQLELLFRDIGWDEKVVAFVDHQFNLNCFMCKTKHIVVIPEDDFQKWQDGEFISEAMPYLSAGTRELLISQMCGTCFDKMFKE